eukprot:11185018-Lingulodinium_polyedra.AAC.1
MGTAAPFFERRLRNGAAQNDFDSGPRAGAAEFDRKRAACRSTGGATRTHGLSRPPAANPIRPRR